MQLLRANTAVDVLIGPFVEDGDGDSPLTGLTLDVELSKNGQALTDSESAAPSHDSAGTVDGYYNCILGTTDTNTEGQLVLVVHHADALPIRHEYMVMAEAAWDSMFVAKDSGFMDVNIKAIDEDEGAPANLEAMYDGTGYAGGTIKLQTDLTQILGHTLTDTGTQLADGFQTFFDVAAPTTMLAINLPNQTMDITGNLSGSVGSLTGHTNQTADNDTKLDAVLAKLLAYFRLALRSDAGPTTDDATELTAINADGGSGAGNYVAGDSLEGIWDTGEANWLTGSGGDATEAKQDTLISVIGALNDVAAAGEVTDADTLVQYVKQLINILIGTTGITTWPAAAAPADGVSISEALRGLYEDRSLPSADYVVVGDTLAGVTLVATTTDVTNDVGITQAGADKAWGTAARVLTANTNLNDLDAAAVEAAVDAAFENPIPDPSTADSINEYIQSLKRVVINKQVITEATGDTVIYKDNDSTVHASVLAAYASDATDTTRKRLE